MHKISLMKNLTTIILNKDTVVFTLCQISLHYFNPSLLFKDVNECIEEKGCCDHVCEDTEGSFICSCFEGYSLMEDQARCQGKLDFSSFPHFSF